MHQKGDKLKQPPYSALFYECIFGFLNREKFYEKLLNFRLTNLSVEETWGGVAFDDYNEILFFIDS